ncbi:MAG: hypothetical protein WC975_01595 [Phycisphaerae bacterium]
MAGLSRGKDGRRQGQAGNDLTKEALKRKSAGQVEDHAPDAGFDQSADLQEFRSDRAGLGVFKDRSFEADAVESFGEDIGCSGQQETELVVEEVMAAGSAGEQVQLFLQTVYWVI